MDMLAAATDLETTISFPSGVDAPSRVTTRSSGGLTSSGTTSKVFSVVKVDCTDTRMCFGRVGKHGTLFCIRTDCVAAKHRTFKMGFAGSDDEMVVIQQVTGSIAFTEPSVKESQVPLDVWNEWKGWTLPLKAWTRKFQAVNATDDKQATYEDIKKETTFLESADEFKTPSKRKREGEGENPFLVGELKAMRYDRVLPMEKEELDKIVEYGGLKPGVLTSVVSGIETNLVLMSEGLEEVAILTASRFEANELEAGMVSGLLSNVRASIGTPVELEPMFAAPTFWGSVSLMAEELSRVSTKFGEIIDDVLLFKTSTSERLDEAKESSDTTVRVLSMVMQTTKKLVADNESLKQMMTEFQRRDRSKRESCGRGSMEDLMADLMVGGTPVSPEGRTHQPLGRADNEIERSLSGEGYHPFLTEDNLRKFKEVIEDVEVLKTSAELSASIKFGDLELRNLQEVSRWSEKNFPDHRYGLIIDPLILLDRILGTDEMDPMTQLKTLESRKKLNISTGAEVSSITSLGHSRPRIFHPGRPMMTCDQNTSCLSKLPKHGTWKSGSQGVSSFITLRMNGLQSSITSNIAYAFSGGGKGCAVAKMITTMSLTASVAFVTQLVTYVDTLFEKLHVHSKFTVDTAWGLTMQVLDRICANLYKPKDGVSSGMHGDRPAICDNILWSSFQTRDIAQQGYIDFSFENHPAISSEFIKFLATNSGFETVKRLTDQMELMKGKLTLLLREVSSALQEWIGSRYRRTSHAHSAM